ncbi:glucose/galactose MFS transporter [Komagataeibacter sp. AV436]|uniref:Glucose/galactose MFS transporter n=1 Tax=Komagataeibacter melomenusus TaxID=2766578 RepID=A0ABX2AEG6_9PROT|nr:glucose/galactose MFS transporter [Komagataeibacter melomenusus]MBV1830444.1 glucose/galactose MFS transporter [Komagataeibacter melomenusus]NPC66047.1 glucose/galactose MFS transporter [Komagataeibacter melomenusus]
MGQADLNHDGGAGTGKAYGARPLLVMAGLFFIIGFVTWLNGPLITFVQVAFGLGPVGAFLVPMCFYLAYFFCAFPATALARRLGLYCGIRLALGVMAAGTLGFGECVGRQWYPGALAGLSVLGAGLTLLQVAVNPYVTLLGPAAQAARRIAWMGIANKLSGIIAPVVFSILVMPDIGGVVARLAQAGPARQHAAMLTGFAHAVVLPYRSMAAALLLVALALRHAGLPDLRLTCRDVAPPTGRMPARAWVGIGVVFVYVGVEVMAGDGIGLYARGMGLAVEQTRFLTAFTLAAMLGGYGLGSMMVPAVVRPAPYLALSAAMGVGLCVAAIMAHGMSSVLCVALLGLANAMMMPILFPLVLHGAGAWRARVNALLVMAFCGGAVMPQCFALLQGAWGMKAAFMGLVVPGYGVIGLFALGAWRRAWGLGRAA